MLSRTFGCGIDDVVIITLKINRRDMFKTRYTFRSRFRIESRLNNRQNVVLTLNWYYIKSQIKRFYIQLPTYTCKHWSFHETVIGSLVWNTLNNIRRKLAYIFCLAKERLSSSRRFPASSDAASFSCRSSMYALKMSANSFWSIAEILLLLLITRGYNLIDTGRENAHARLT